MHLFYAIAVASQQQFALCRRVRLQLGVHTACLPAPVRHRVCSSTWLRSFDALIRGQATTSEPLKLVQPS